MLCRNEQVYHQSGLLYRHASPTQPLSFQHEHY